MIDLHCHILPGIDDGAPDLQTSLQMARMAQSDGTRILACTPHIYPGLYMNDASGIRAARDRLQAELDRHGIALQLVVGADAHLVPELLQGLRDGRIPSLHGSRYFLLEPSHHVAPPRLEESIFQLLVAGFVPVVTHPERLTWIESHYDTMVGLIRQGAWMQITAGALTGQFGPRARYWGEKFVGEGHAHLLASDGHSVGRRAPCLSGGLEVAQRLVGSQEARRLVVDRPQAVIDNVHPQHVVALPVVQAKKGFLQRWLGR